MGTLFIVNGSAYGSEETWSALRLAASLLKHGGEEVRVFLLGDGVTAAKAGQTVPDGYYNLEKMLRVIVRRGGEVGACGTCMDARGIGDPERVDVVLRGTLEQLTDWTREADRVLVF